MKFYKNASFLFGACLAAVLVGDWLLYGAPVGWNLALCVLGVLLLIAVRNMPAFVNRAVMMLVFAVLGLILALCEEPTVIGATLAILGLGMVALTARGGCPASLRDWMLRWLQLPGHILVRPWMDAWVACKWFGRHPSAEPMVMRWTMLWTLPLLLGGVFVLIFVAANPIIAQWAGTLWHNILTFLYSLPTWLSLGRICFWMIVALGTYGLLRARRGARQCVVVLPPPLQPATVAMPMMVIRCLMVFNLIFGVQTLLDLMYLWGGAALPQGMTYADYAHRGSYALIAAALLAALFVIITFRAGGAAERFVWARRLVYLWIFQNVVLTLAAAWRLRIYVGAYSLTQFRVAAALWMLLVAVGLVLIIWRLLSRRSNTWLLHANVMAAAALLYLCAFSNFNGWIAWFNVEHCKEFDGRGPALDVAYLRELGPEALPAVRLNAQEQAVNRKVMNDLQQAQIALENSLAIDMSDWRGWTWRRQRLIQGTHVGMAGIDRRHSRSALWQGNCIWHREEPTTGDNALGSSRFSVF